MYYHACRLVDYEKVLILKDNGKTIFFKNRGFRIVSSVLFAFPED